MITKEELLVALEGSSRNLHKSNEVFGLALKGLESESTVKRLIQDRDNWKMMHENLVCEHRIAVNNLNNTVDGLTRSRNLWRKKHDDLADELDDKIIALEDKLRNTVTLQFHDETVATAARQIASLRDERNAFQRLVGEMQTENSCMHADLENMCKEQEALKSKIDELEEAHCAKNADMGELLTENEELKIKIEKFKAFFTRED